MDDLITRISARLTAVEWHSEAWPDTCPACTQTREVGHRPDCWLAVTLTDLRDGDKSEPEAPPRGREQRFITTDERLLVIPG